MNPAKKRIFYILLFMILFLSIPILVLGLKYIKDLRSGAQSTIPPKNIQIFNANSNAFDIAWTTDEAATGKVRYGLSESSLNLEAIDVRGAEFTGNSHVVNVSGLEPNTQYFYKIVSNGEDSDGTESFTTYAPIITEPLSIFGTSDSTGSLIRISLIEKGTAAEVQANVLGTAVLDNTSWSLDGGNFRFSDGRKIDDFNYYLLNIEVLDNQGDVVARKVTPNIGSTTPITLQSGIIDNPVAVASEYTAPTTRNTPTPPPTSAEPSVTPTPSIQVQPSISPTPTAVVPTVTEPPIANVTVSKAEIVNISDNTFTVIWETSDPTNSYLKYTINGGQEINAFDKRSNRKLARSLRTHYVEIIDTNNPAGTNYEITLVNNGVEWNQKLNFQKVGATEVPGIDTLYVKFTQTGNFIDQIITVNIPGESTKIATTPNSDATATLDLTKLRVINNLAQKFSLADQQALTFEMMGGTLLDPTIYRSTPISDLRQTEVIFDSNPLDMTPFKIYYINIEDGEIIDSTKPEFGGEGFKPNSNINIKIEKQ